MTQKITQVDAFTNQPFGGNSAAVCVLNASRDEEWMQNVAAEMNLSETAFLLKQDDGFSLRWFTPTVEVPLCGHATLASAHVLFSKGYLEGEETARFYTKSGLLTAEKKGDWIELNFPVNFSEIIETPVKLSDALGVRENQIKSVGKNSLGYLVELDNNLVEDNLIENIKPDFTLLKDLFPQVIVTSLGKDNSKYDFVSRFFAPGLGINEDPVTGAAHCCLAPFWRKKLGKNDFLAYQASSRGGVLRINYDGGERVYIQGQAVSVMEGEFFE